MMDVTNSLKLIIMEILKKFDDENLILIAADAVIEETPVFIGCTITVFDGLRALICCNNAFYICNWCCGKDLLLLNRVLRIFFFYCENAIEDVMDNKALPLQSNIKPIYSDVKFMSTVDKLELIIPDSYKSPVEISFGDYFKLITLKNEKFK